MYLSPYWKQITEKMSSFGGRSNSVVSTMLIFLTSMLLILASQVAARPHSSLFKLESREEMVHLAGYGEEKLSTVVVTGTVLCQDPALQGQAQLHAWPVSGASVGIKCHTREMRSKSSWTHCSTDQYGDFIVDLPSHLHAVPNLEKICTVKVLRVPKNLLCQPAYVGKHSGMKLSSVGNGVRTYSAGTIKFLHVKPKPSRENIKKRSGNSFMYGLVTSK